MNDWNDYIQEYSPVWFVATPYTIRVFSDEQAAVAFAAELPGVISCVPVIHARELAAATAELTGMRLAHSEEESEVVVL